LATVRRCNVRIHNAAEFVIGERFLVQRDTPNHAAHDLSARGLGVQELNADAFSSSRNSDNRLFVWRVAATLRKFAHLQAELDLEATPERPSADT
jgi:hypothetical protein